MHPTIEYISAGTIIMMILGITGQYATNLVYDRINLIELSSEQEKADKILDAMLLSPGRPSDWNGTYEEPEVLGFAQYNAINLYRLDARKVKCLGENNATIYIPPTRVRDLIGLSPYYYISINLSPVFNITVNWQVAQKVHIKVTNQWNVPAPNVNITAAYLNSTIDLIDSSDITAFVDNSLYADYYSNITDAMGICTLNRTREGGGILLILAKQMIVKSITTWPTLADEVIGFVESSMGTPSYFRSEVVYRNVEIDGLNYIVKFTLWS